MQQNTFHSSRNSGWAQTLSQSEIDAGLRSYMLRVYNYMALGVAFTGLVILFMANSPELMYNLAVGPVKWVLFAGLIGMGFFSTKIITMRSAAVAQAFYWGYCALWGVMISPMIAYFLTSDGGILALSRAFFITAGSFAGISLFGYLTKRDLGPMASFLSMAIIGLLLVGLINMFFFEASTGFNLMYSIVAVLLFAGMTAYQTQAIKNMYYQADGREMAERMAIFGALQLYGSFIVLFIHILNIVGIMGGDE